MSTVSTFVGGRGLVAVKGAPETIKGMLGHVPKNYGDTYKWFTRGGSRVLALGMKEYESITVDKVGLIPFLSDENDSKFPTDQQDVPG